SHSLPPPTSTPFPYTTLFRSVSTFDPNDPATDVLDRLRRFGVTDPKPPSRQAETAREDFDLAPGQSRRIAELAGPGSIDQLRMRSEEHTSELQSRFDLVCRLL